MHIAKELRLEMDTLKPPRQLIIGIMFSILLSGCASVDQFLNQGETSAQILQLQIEQQNQQIGLLVEQQNTILAELQKQPALFVLQQQNIAQLANKLEDYVQLRQQVISNSQLIASFQSDEHGFNK